MADIIHFHRVSHRYGDSEQALTDVSFRLGRGEMAFVTGHSGAGKSTLLRLAALLSKPTRGHVVVNGMNLSTLPRRKVPEFRQHIGIVFQNFNLLNDRTVYDNVAMPLVIRGYRPADIGKRVRAALDAVGLLGKEKVNPLTLSGGEQQRVGIARAIVTKPVLLLADEPTGNLDPQMARDVMQLFGRFNQVGVSVLVATHAIDLIRPMGRRMIHLEHGNISRDQPPGFLDVSRAPA
jgi:cell division transport system ATP-binding protein